ncbi:AraC family transcriptional regulator [Nitrospira sp. KM1]|uniref:GlxA family transcriptional regulator n=1 Tax=Nitrospira sp. KM1 TaxID=1936990 RepID=UPI0013A73EF3|nr:helix-turn-helix domain-containing protein [Nitrospira sp. KM1]MBS0165194.1 helix-turn-helix domain-containing protein [Nitrospira sp.]MBX3327817.1 helix-turn-helix domain-containing protein [Nitrospira sp.]BCA53876.1 AraC family transcriptional regulator [Nitrospira sp. KM1]
MRIYIVALQNTFDTGLSTLLDTFSVANELAASSKALTTRFDVTIVGVRSRVTTSHGLSIPARRATGLAHPDIALVPAVGAKMPDTLSRLLDQREIVDAQSLLRHWFQRGTMLGAACTGTFILAEASLLNGHHATTSWWLAPFFRERYPQVVLDESRMIVHSSPFITAGAALAHLDLALWLVRHRSPALAALTARYLVIDSRPMQATFAIPDHLAHADPFVERFERWARRRLGDGFSLHDAARAVRTSPRTLTRRLHAVIGKSPLAYFQDLRVERAVHLLQTSNHSVDQIADRVGYASGATLRTLIQRKIGRGVRELRARA